MRRFNKYAKASNTRITLIRNLFLLVYLVLIIRLYQIQIRDHDEYNAQAQEQHWNLLNIPASRGDILSRDGFPLATTQVSYLMYLEPKKISNKVETIEKLATKLAEFNKFDLEDPYNFHKQKLEKSLALDLFWIKVIGDLSPYEKEQVEELEIEGSGFEESPLRYYPEGTLASHVLGFVASDSEGNKTGYFGIEGFLNGDLVGKHGRLVQEQDAFGAPILVGGYKKIDPIEGRDIILTIDRGAQYIVERLLEEGVKKYDSVSGTVIVMEPFTGDVIALANYPTYDPANFNDYGDKETFEGNRKKIERRNLAISQTYEPGSVLKALTVSTAVDLGLVTPDTPFVDAGPVQYSDYVIDNWDGNHHGVQTITQLLQKSNNIGAAWVGHLVGSENLYNYLSKFGIGTITGIDLEGEDTGILRPYQDWTAIDLATVAFGQGVSATPLQVLNAFNAIANGGVLMQPRIFDRIIDGEETVEIPTKKIRRVLSRENSDGMVDLLTKAVKGNESKYFNLKSYDIAGKTGTAQIPVAGKYDPNKTNATFVGFLSNSKRYSMIVKLEEPNSSIYAAETAVPLWMSITEELVKYFGIPVDHDVDVPVPVDVPIESNTNL